MNDKENQYFRENICMTKENIKKNPFAFLKKSVFCQILRKKTRILPNSKGNKSVYTDKISMSGRSAHDAHDKRSIVIEKRQKSIHK